MYDLYLHKLRAVVQWLIFYIFPQGMVEKWLIQVEEMMIKSLQKVSADAVAAYVTSPRGKWVQEWPGQVSLLYCYILHIDKAITMLCFLGRSSC